MNQEEVRKRKDWVKNAAIVFLTIMLVLTFFSNTIMNYSLPEVATQYVESGTITAKVRGTGNVEAADPYNIVAKESRVISSVAVKQGDEVEKDQVIYYLEDAESEELTQAQKDLEELKLTYMKGLFGNNVSSDIISKVASGRTDGFSTLQTKVADMQNRMDAAQARVKECQEALEKLTLQSTISINNAGVNTIEAENAVTRADVELSNAQNDESRAEQEFNQEISRRKAEITNEINELKRRIEDIQILINGAGAVTERTGDSSVDIDVNNDSSGDNNSSSNTTTIDGISVPDKQTLIEEYKTARDEALAERDKKLDEIYQAATGNGYQNGKNINELKAWVAANGKEEDYRILLQDYDMADAQYNYAVSKLQEAEKNLSGYDGNLAALQNLNSQLAVKEAELNRVASITYETGDDIKSAQNKLSEAKQNLTDQTNANKQAETAYKNQIANAEAALKNAQAVYDLLKEEQDEMNADINAELDLAKVSKDIAQKEEEIAKLMEKSMGAAITAPVAGTVSSLAYVAGETTKPEETAAVLQVEGKGYTLKVSVTNEQARKVQVGDTAELQNAWYYDDAQVILTGIKPDPDNPGQNKLLEFNVTGSSIQAGQALSISVGQRSSEYEFVVPNSAVREDNNGKFILIVESKSGPLSNRYIATRVDVEVLASDDNYTAISAGLYGYEYVITTSTKPVEAGKQVRLNESQ
ncbi:biotin/lipoyl-binding protein [Parablautia intestinalis]|jgi:multidrug efflux pump subunit AcrA (membrane-fusion protein)|uniref:Biotin/lipoyl-binding protein n=4 Tax=Parablautia intestinalis TaxID=2320100 RepID=A0A3A9AZB5_9FIRM|nr:biotin/lipoyl-binding protein [Parablautia intestinalis]MCI8616293.1 biotin/lipoyl-binding protein [Lachnospiraceae bacterium]RKI92883.1 biotin/lipoyl-binding protein [Parablautia intestinalis]